MPIPRKGGRDEECRQMNKNEMEGSHTQRMEGDKDDNEEEYGSISDQRRMKKERIRLQGEFKKIKPPTFDGEVEEDAEDWMINMNKYFQTYVYEDSLKARLAIYHVQGKATLWWEEVKTVHGIKE